MSSGKQLVDRFGRVHDKLRISVTDTCDIRCYYCMPEAGRAFTPRSRLLSVDEIERLVRIGANLGLRKVRLTGGEPLVRKDLSTLISRLMRIEGVESIPSPPMAFCSLIGRKNSMTQDCAASMYTLTLCIARRTGSLPDATLSMRSCRDCAWRAIWVTDRSRSTPLP